MGMHGMPVILGIILALVALLIGALIGYIYRKNVGERAIGSAETKARNLILDAENRSESIRKDAQKEAKEEAKRIRSEAERDAKEKREEAKRTERRLIQKEESLDKKTENLEKKEETLAKKIKEAEARLVDIENLKREEFDKLERISGFTKEQAKELLLQTLESELTHEKAVRIMDYTQKTKDEADSIAREIVATAIQRCAADHASETTVGVVTLPNDEMKGRIIGREGRNIRTLETITGVDLIIDDTPETITVSSFDPVRREIARLTLEKLISDGRIHPARIEDMYEKAKREVETTIKQTGERALIDAGVAGVHPELVKLLGKLRYRTSFGQNVLNHSLEVSYLAGLMAAELGADVKTAKRAGLLHDIGKALDHEMDGSHIELGVEWAKKYKEKEAVVHLAGFVLLFGLMIFFTYRDIMNLIR